MKLYNVKLLTITCEILAQENIIEILKNMKSLDTLPMKLMEMVHVDYVDRD